MLRLVVLLSIAVCGSYGLNLNLKAGACEENIAVFQNLDLDRFAGTWYVKQRSAAFYSPLNCTKSVMTRVEKGLDFANDGVIISSGQPKTMAGTAEVADAAVPAKLNYKFGSMPAFPVQYYVLDTDYDSYNVLYACKSFGILHYDMMWIMTRARAGISASALESARQVFTTIGKNPDDLENIIQAGCTN